jgi:hypothetical protein
MILPERVQEAKSGRKEHLRWLQGYYGPIGEHFFVGRGEQGSMLRLSGALATSLFDRKCLNEARCTRIDIQVTASPPAGVDAYLHESYARIDWSQKGRGRHQAVELVDTNYGAKMLTIGSRQSETYARVYDKFRESKIEAYRGMVRLEIEVKKPQSQDLFNFLRQDTMLVPHTQHIVAQFFEARGMEVFWKDYALNEPVVSQKRAKSDETRLAWVASQWVPTMRNLVNNGKELELAAALLPPGTDNATIDELAVLLKMNYHG